MSQFKIGDVVMVDICHIPRHQFEGSSICVIGTIVADAESTMPGVEFICNMHGHDCDGAGIYGNCFWIYEDHIIKLEA